MREKLKSHYLKFGPRPFVIFSVLTLMVTDIINGQYLKLYWLKRGASLILVEQSAARSGLILEDLSQDTIMEAVGFVNNTFYFFLFLILANNLFFYLFYAKKRLWAQGYVLFYTLTAALFSVAFVFDNSGLSSGWIIYNLLTIPYYLYVFMGVKLLKAETTLGDEKKER